MTDTIISVGDRVRLNDDYVGRMTTVISVTTKFFRVQLDGDPDNKFSKKISPYGKFYNTARRAKYLTCELLGHSNGSI